MKIFEMFSFRIFSWDTRITYRHSSRDSLLWNWMKNLINSREIDVMLFASYTPRCYFFIKSKRCDNSMIAVHKPVRESTVTTTLKFDNGCWLLCGALNISSYNICGHLRNICGLLWISSRSKLRDIVSFVEQRALSYIVFVDDSTPPPKPANSTAAAHPLDQMLTVKTSTACVSVCLLLAGEKLENSVTELSNRSWEGRVTRILHCRCSAHSSRSTHFQFWFSVSFHILELLFVLARCVRKIRRSFSSAVCSLIQLIFHFSLTYTYSATSHVLPGMECKVSWNSSKSTTNAHLTSGNVHFRVEAILISCLCFTLDWAPRNLCSFSLCANYPLVLVEITRVKQSSSCKWKHKNERKLINLSFWRFTDFRRNSSTLRRWWCGRCGIFWDLWKHFELNSFVLCLLWLKSCV